MIRMFGLFFGAICTVFAGCQKYDPEPLDLTGHLRDWMATDIAQPELQRYSQDALVKLCGPGAKLNVADGLDLSEAEAVALYLNPDLRVARAETDVPLASARNVGVETLVVFQTFPQYDVGPGLDNRWIIPSRVAFTIPLSGRLEAERERAWAAYSAAWRQVAIAEWELLSELRSVWLDCAAKRREIALVEEYIKRIAPLRKSAGKQAPAGKPSSTDGPVLEISEQSREAELVRLRGEAEVLRLRLLDLMGLKPGPSPPLHVALCSFPVTVPPDRRADELLRTHPRIALLNAEYEVAEKALKRKIREQYPDILLGPSHNYHQGINRLGLGLWVVNLSSFGQNRRGIAEGRANRTITGNRARAELQHLVSQVTRAQVARGAARAEAARLRNVVSPLVQRQLAKSVKRVRRDGSNVPALLKAMDHWLDTRRDILRADLAEAQAANVLYTMLHPRWVTGKAPTGTR